MICPKAGGEPSLPRHIVDSNPCTRMVLAAHGLQACPSTWARATGKCASDGCRQTEADSVQDASRCKLWHRANSYGCSSNFRVQAQISEGVSGGALPADEDQQGEDHRSCRRPWARLNWAPGWNLLKTRVDSLENKKQNRLAVATRPAPAFAGMGQDAGLRPGVVELVPCQDNGYRDSCGICNGDGSSCSAVATVTCFAPKHRPP